jgi:hypothetical protein
MMSAVCWSKKTRSSGVRSPADDNKGHADNSVDKVKARKRFMMFFWGGRPSVACHDGRIARRPSD